MTKKALHFVDAKSDKFWWIETQGSDFVVNFGKTGTSGRYQIKEFDSDEDCEKEAEKLVLQKMKKGYKENPDFDFINHLYFDDEEYGPHPLTSHPNFRAHFIDELYYSCGDEETPFGSDEGSDTLADMQEVVRKKGWINFALYPQSLIENVWDMKYIPSTDMNENEVKALVEQDEMNLIQSDMVTYASAFAQIKITGYVNEELKERAISAMNRMNIVAKINGWMKETDSSEITDMMIKNLSSFNKYK